MPDDYYVSQYSGEEIDERLTAAHNAVRYDAAQTLTDAQKTQARNNISAMQGIESTDHPGCYYVLNGSAVEWINPPMLLGVEYRTTERYLGKPVYVQAVNFGTLPNANTKSVTWATPGVVLAVLSAEATSNLGEPIGLGASLSGTEITANKTTLYIKSSGNYSDNTAVFRVKYTKTTD